MSQSSGSPAQFPVCHLDVKPSTPETAELTIEDDALEVISGAAILLTRSRESRIMVPTVPTQQEYSDEAVVV